MQYRTLYSAVCCVAFASAVKVGVLSNHKPEAWASSANCSGSNEDLAKCNLKMYEKVFQTAAATNLSLVVFPEGYTLGSEPKASDYFEPYDLATAVGVTPCGGMDAAVQPVLVSLSCAAKTFKVAAAVNVFSIDPTGERHITEIIMDETGKMIAGYHKHVLFPTEKKVITPGPFNPTSFVLLGRRWGIVICYEGIYPSISGDWSQMDALAKQNATAFVWSVGDTAGTMKKNAEKIAEKYKVQVLASEGYDGLSKKGSAFVMGAEGAEPAGTANAPIQGLAALGYTAAPFLRHADI
jgi:predicted amidohydrolase